MNSATTTDKTEDKTAAARAEAMAQYESIAELVNRLDIATDDDIYDASAKTLAEGAGFTVRCVGEAGSEIDDDGETIEPGFHWLSAKGKLDDTAYETEDEAWRACCDDNSLRPSEDEAREAIQEDPLSVQVRGGWYSPGDAKPEAEEFELLLCTGGPAVRIRGELDRGEPDRAWLECQDWFTPWTQVFNVEQDTLLAYARCFYFGD